MTRLPRMRGAPDDAMQSGEISDVDDTGESDSDAEIVEGLRQLERTLGSGSYGKVCAIFLQTCPTQVRDLNVAVAAGDIATARRLAHQLEGSMACFGAVRLGHLAAQMERPEQGADRLAALVAELDLEFARVHDILTRSVATS